MRWPVSIQKLYAAACDPDLPSYVHPVLAEVEGDLALAGDCWDLLRGRKEAHLPKEVKEPKRAYDARVMRSSYPSFFRDAIIAFAGALTRFELRNAPALLTKHLQDVDRSRNSLKAFMAIADAFTLRDGGVLLTVDMPKGPRPANLAEEKAQGRRPQLAIVERMNLLNWFPDPDADDGRPLSLTILEWVEVPVGRYGVELQPRYRRMDGGIWELIELKDGEEIVVDNGFFADPSGQLLTHPPVRWYSASNEGFGRGQLPLLALANHTLDWFREYSDLKELLHKTAMPVAVRIGMEAGKPLTLGPNSGLDLPQGGDFKIVEVQGSSLQRHQEHLEHIESLIDRATLSFLFSGAAQKTATQAVLESAQMQATLSTLAEAKASTLQSIFELWCSFSGETLGLNAGADMASGVFEEPVGNDKLTLGEKLFNSGLLSKRSMLYLQNKAGFLPPNVTPEQEIDQIEKEKPKPAVTPGLNDPLLTGEELPPVKPVFGKDDQTDEAGDPPARGAAARGRVLPEAA